MSTTKPSKSDDTASSNFLTQKKIVTSGISMNKKRVRSKENVRPRKNQSRLPFSVQKNRLKITKRNTSRSFIVSLSRIRAHYVHEPLFDAGF